MLSHVSIQTVIVQVLNNSLFEFLPQRAENLSYFLYKTFEYWNEK